MTVSPFDSQLFSQLLSDAEVAPFFSDQAYLRALIEFEIALAKVEAEIGVIPGDAYPQIEQKLRDFTPSPQVLSEGTANSGVPIPTLLKEACKILGPEVGQYLHWGATSQDAIDTGLILRLKQVVVIPEKRFQVFYKPALS